MPPAEQGAFGERVVCGRAQGVGAAVGRKRVPLAGRRRGLLPQAGPNALRELPSRDLAFTAPAASAPLQRVGDITAGPTPGRRVGGFGAGHRIGWAGGGTSCGVLIRGPRRTRCSGAAGNIEEFITPPPAVLEDLVSAFEQDQRVKRYDTFDQLRDYCRRTPIRSDDLCCIFAGALLNGTPPGPTRSAPVCNWRTSGRTSRRDYEIGRVYLPRETRARFGYSDADLEARTTNGAFVDALRFEVDRAGRLLVEGLPLIERLPWRLQIDIDLLRGEACGHWTESSRFVIVCGRRGLSSRRPTSPVCFSVHWHGLASGVLFGAVLS